MGTITQECPFLRQCSIEHLRLKKTKAIALLTKRAREAKSTGAIGIYCLFGGQICFTPREDDLGLVSGWLFASEKCFTWFETVDAIRWANLYQVLTVIRFAIRFFPLFSII